MGILRDYLIFAIAFSAIELPLLLVVGVNFFPPPGDKECNSDFVTKILNLVNAREKFACVHLHNFPALLYRTFFPFKNKIADFFLWQLSLHSINVLVICILLFIVTKFEKDYSRPVLRKFRRVIARCNKHNISLIAKRSAFPVPSKYYRTL